MEKLTCIMDCKKETQAVRFLSKCAIVYSAIAGIISFVGTILSIISATESRADSFSEILYAFLPTIIACGICFALALLFLALSSILHALTTSARIAELRATRDGVPYTDVYNTIRTKSTPPNTSSSYPQVSTCTDGFSRLDLPQMRREKHRRILRSLRREITFLKCSLQLRFRKGILRIFTLYIHEKGCGILPQP